MKQHKKLRLLLIGPLPKLQPRKVGGARVSFSQLATYLAEQKYPHRVIETQPYAAGWKRYLNPFLLLLRFLRHLPSTEIVWLNVSQGGTRYLAPLLYLASKLAGKKFVFRPFGSSLQEDYQAYPKWQKWYFRKTVLRADLLFLQTHRLINFFGPLAKRTEHLPTSRKKPAEELLKKSKYQQRFIYLGHIKEDKGISELLEARRLLGPTYQVHLYGPIMEKTYQWLSSEPNSPYQGVLEQAAVASKLSEYDVLVLPTYFRGEGYPGAIIEAYALGIPVLTTNWRSIPEIVTDGQTGILIPPRSVPALVAAMQSFNSANYPAFSAQAKQFFECSFEQSLVLGRALQAVNDLNTLFK